MKIFQTFSLVLFGVVIIVLISCGSDDVGEAEVSGGDGETNTEQDSDSESETEPSNNTSFEFRATPPLQPGENAAVYYVAPNGSDDNAGTSYETPFKTFEAAINLLNPGDFVYALGGTYNEDNAGRGYNDAILPIIYLDRNTPSGTEAEPIVIKNYPGEMPVLDMAGINASPGGNAVTIEVLQAHHIYIEGFEVINGMILIRGGDNSGTTHDITIQNNHVHDFTVHGGENPGLIKVGPGGTGAYNIYIRNNRLHDLYDYDEPGEPVPNDFQHFGAVTIMSACTYLGYEVGCTKSIHILDNHISKVPQAFFFKNPMEGPILIENNFITETRGIGGSYASNVHMSHNLVVGVAHGFNGMGTQAGSYTEQQGIIDASGHNYIIENNTFIDLQSLLAFRSGSNHIIRNNIFFGMSSRKSSNIWDTTPFLLRMHADGSVANESESSLHTVTSNHNCFITELDVDDFLHTKRRPDVTYEVTYNFLEAQSVFEFDQDSEFVVGGDKEVFFTNPSEGDYSLRDCEICQCVGY